MTQVTPINRIQLLQRVTEFKNASTKTIHELAENSEIINLRQGQTLLRVNVLETHAFVVDGALRLLAKEPFSSDLFSVGTAEARSLIGIVGMLRQSPCEGAIARRPSIRYSTKTT